MRWSYNLERAVPAAAWLFAVAALVFAMVIVGGATRLTGSGLSITQWKPVSGVLPPMTPAAWIAEFHNYQRIPQYRLVNRGMTLEQFKPLFWWEWAHRLLGRLVGFVFLLPFVALLALRRVPRRLIAPCGAIFALGAVQGLVGWWMVASGLEARLSVAPERLAAHLGLALLILSASVWTGLEAWFGRPRGTSGVGARWRWTAVGLLALVSMQILLGALVAGNQAGRIDTDWPLMGGRLFPAGYAAPGGLWSTLAHSAPAVQFDHRIVAYALFIAAIAAAGAAGRAREAAGTVRTLFAALATLVSAQAVLGVATLRMAAPVGMGLAHQALAVVVLTCAVALAWRTQRT